MRLSPRLIAALAACGLVACGTDAVAQKIATIKLGDIGPQPVAISVSELKLLNLNVQGQVTDEFGQPLYRATVSIYSPQYSAVGGALQTRTDAKGNYTLNLPNRNVALVITAAGYYSELVPLALLGNTNAAYNVENVDLVARKTHRVRLIAGGDCMFGRRFADSDGNGIEGDSPGDLIHPGSRGADAISILRYMRELVRMDDASIVNFETPCSIQSQFRHPYKTYSFSTNPETLVALTDAKIGAVSLGNNHSYDYLDPGMIDTINNLNANNIPWFGAGLDEAKALANSYNMHLAGGTLSLQGFCGIIPFNFPAGTPQPWPEAYLYVATANKGGSLQLTGPNVDAFYAYVPPTNFPICVFHGGDEYSEGPSGNMGVMFQNALAHGKLVVAHHPHTVHGIALTGPDDDPNVALMSLGNFVFDQDVWETFHSMVAIIDLDIDTTGAGKHHVYRVRLIPFVAQDYVPRLTCGAWLQRMGRHIGHLSTYFTNHGRTTAGQELLRSAVVFPTQSSIVVALHSTDYTTSSSSLATSIPLENGASQPFRPSYTDPAMFLTSLSGPAGCTAQLGRESLIQGTFEDFSISENSLQNTVWTQSAFRQTGIDQPYEGLADFVMSRNADNFSTITTLLRNRLTMPVGALSYSIRLAVRGENAGKSRIHIQYIQRNSRNVQNEELLEIPLSGDFAWQTVSFDLHPGPTAGHFRISIEMDPPAIGKALLHMDDLAFISWYTSLGDLSLSPTIAAPNNYDWVRLTGTGTAVTINEGFTQYRRAALPPPAPTAVVQGAVPPSKQALGTVLHTAP